MSGSLSRQSWGDSSSYTRLSAWLAVPLVVTLLVSAVVWDVFCFRCSSEQKWQTAVRHSAKNKKQSSSVPQPARETDETLSRGTGEGEDAPAALGWDGMYGFDYEDYREFVEEWNRAMAAEEGLPPGAVGDADSGGDGGDYGSGGDDDPRPPEAAVDAADAASAATAGPPERPAGQEDERPADSAAVNGSAVVPAHAAGQSGASRHATSVETGSAAEVPSAAAGKARGKAPPARAAAEVGSAQPAPAPANGTVSDDDTIGAGGGLEGGFGFKLLEPGSVAYDDVEGCPGAAEPAVGDFRPLHPGVNMLVLAGVQKGGTTWMADALMQHPAILPANYRFRPIRQKHHATKEVHYLDRWPHFPGSEAEYAGCFPAPAVRAATANATAQLTAAGVDLESLSNPKGVREAYTNLTHDVAFLDATPSYLPIAHVPPRASQIMPHVRLVVVLRDPVARALSAHNMDRGRFCGTSKKGPEFFLRGAECPKTAFAETVEAATGEEARGIACAFDGLDKGGPHTWHDCYRCWHMYLNQTYCHTLPPPRPFDSCHPAVLNYVQLSMYAPQLAWWLAFFPPEQILILTSAELHHPSTQVQALNRILNHARLPHARRFTHDWLSSMDLDGFEGTYPRAHSERGIDAAAATLRRRFQKPAEDLVRLVNRFWPHMNFTGLPDEV
eukprot:jgi/Ulvmu1/8880/UM049_0062.1